MGDPFVLMAGPVVVHCGGSQHCINHDAVVVHVSLCQATDGTIHHSVIHWRHGRRGDRAKSCHVLKVLEPGNTPGAAPMYTELLA
jgi:hypothetical protein